MTTIPQSALVRSKLETAIIDGRYPPGTKLDPDALAVHFNCSRTPVREALQQLAVSGLINVFPKRGTFVARLSVEELTERFELMAEIEAICGRFAARRMTDPELAELRLSHAICQKLSSAGDSDGYYFENSRFHHLIYHAAHNASLTAEAVRLHAMLQPYRRMQLRVRNRTSRSYAEHEEILAAIASGNETAAADLLRNHVMIQGDRFNDLMAAMRESFPAKD